MTSASKTFTGLSFLKRLQSNATAPVLGMCAGALFVSLFGGTVFAAEAPALLSPLQGQQIDSPMPVISGNAAGASEVLVFIDSALNGTAQVSGGVFSYVPFVPLASGIHSIQLKARDAATKELTNPSIVTVITVIPNPRPTFTTPASGAKLGQDRAWVGGVAQNDSLVRVFVDGAEYARTNARNHVSGTASFGVQLKGLTIGEHVVDAIARDSRGKESFLSDSLTVLILPPTPAPVLFRPVVNADSGIERPFIAGIAKNGLVVFIVIDGKLAQSIPLGQDPSGVINFKWQPREALRLGRHTIEAYASDHGKLSNNSTPIFWQVGDVAAASQAPSSLPTQVAPEQPAPVVDDEPQTRETTPISVVAPEESKPLTVKDDLMATEEPVVPDVISDVVDAPEGRVAADDDKVLGADVTPDTIALSDGNEPDSDDGVTKITPGAVVRVTDEAVQGFTFNTSLVIGIVILVFLLLSILVWYIQEKRAQLGERVVNIFREEDESGAPGQPSDKNRLPGDVRLDPARPLASNNPSRDEKKKKDNTPPPPPEPPRNDPPFGFDGPNDLPPPPPPMF